MFLILSYAEESEAGGIGDGLDYEITGNTLRLFGTGDMDDYSRNPILSYLWEYDQYRYKIEYIELGEGITSLAPECFCHLPNLKGEIVIPKSLTSIGSGAFQNTKITKLTFQEGSNLKSIGKNAFSGCTQLTGTLELPSTLTSIGTNAFKNCSKMTGSVKIPDGVSSLDGCFDGCSSLTGDIKLPEKLVFLTSNTFRGCTGITGTPVLTQMYNFGVGQGVFEGCTGLTGDIVMSSNYVTMVCDNAFKGCTGITSFKMLMGACIGEDAFNGCTGLKKITLGTGVRSIATTAFSGIDFYDEDGNELVLNESNIDEFRGYVFEKIGGKMTRVAQTNEEIPDNINGSTSDHDTATIGIPAALLLVIVFGILITSFRRP